LFSKLFLNSNFFCMQEVGSDKSTPNQLLATGGMQQLEFLSTTFYSSFMLCTV
jgi:hypothetical protein